MVSTVPSCRYLRKPLELYINDEPVHYSSMRSVTNVSCSQLVACDWYSDRSLADFLSSLASLLVNVVMYGMFVCV